ncbi:hypothetical protein CW774_004809 [Escherichia coli]|nr:hypothetical protein [Escherichia coli]
MTVYESIYKILLEQRDARQTTSLIKRGKNLLTNGALSINELADKYNIDAKALERAIAKSKSLKQGM